MWWNKTQVLQLRDAVIIQVRIDDNQFEDGCVSVDNLNQNIMQVRINPAIHEHNVLFHRWFF